MNKKRMLELADHIETLHPSRFSMDMWFKRFRRARDGRKIGGSDRWVETADMMKVAREMSHTCDTAGCIAGWAIALHPQAGRHAIRSTPYGYKPKEHAAAILGLDFEEANALFNNGMNMTPKRAAQRIREAVKLGYVPTWSKHL